MPERIQFLGIDGTGRLGDIFVLFSERQENPAQLLAAELIDAGIAREPEQPGLELRRGLEPVDRPDHLDENLLGQVLHVIASSGHGVHEACHAMLIADNELTLGSFVALLSPAHEVGQRGRWS
jgi:hypothetical protein